VRRRRLGALLLVLLGGCGGEPPPAPRTDGPVAGWPHYGNDPGGTRYSPLTQIDRENVRHLEVAWVHHHGDVLDGSGPDGATTAFQATPILRGDTLYYCTPLNRIVALDAETGEERWSFDPEVARETWNLTCRGVAAWRDPERPQGAACATRILSGTTDARLLAVDAATGRPCADFGEGGEVDLTPGVGDPRPGEYGVTSPPTVIGDVVAVGALVGDSGRIDAPAGVVRGYDARSGALRWAWDPAPPELGPAPPDAEGRPGWHRATANAWSIFSADAERDLLFVPTGSASPDFYGGLREGRDRYASAVVALRGSTGELVWHFQAVHHDLWDYDTPAQPTLLEVEQDGRRIPAVAQATKMGHVFVLHRETGEPVFAVEERPVPRGDLPGETYAPTQPFPTFPPPLHPAGLRPEDAWGLTPWDRGRCEDLLRRHRNQGIFTPPSREGSIQYPGVAGGTNWGGVAWDPERRLLVTNQSRIPFVQTAVPRAEAGGLRRDGPGVGLFRQEGTPFVERQEVLLSPLGIPCAPPPWGTLTAVDFAAESLRWEVPFGSTRGLAPFPFWLELGVPNMGGPVVTASGLLFIGASTDGHFRAYDVETGEELWRTKLPAGGQATPMTYRLRADGRQYVVIAAGGHGRMGTELGDALVAFALP